MRDIAITLIVFYGLVHTLKKPYIGVLLWSWLGYMNPHRLAYGFAFDAPFALVTAIVLLWMTATTKQKQKFPFNSITALWIFFIVFMGITTLQAVFPVDALFQYKKVVKIQLVVFVTMILITDFKKLKQLIWVIVLSIGYFSVKGGLFTLMTGGGFRVWGPSGTFIEDNNGLAVAVLMIVPLMVFLYQTEYRGWVKKSLIFAIVFSLFTVVGSQSRGAFVAIGAVGLFYWYKSQSKAISGIIISLLTMVIFAFMPQSWFQRMDTINSYEEDGSAMGRINAWKYAYNAANHNLFGMGFESWSPMTFAVYAPNPDDVHAAHSIYFTVLADHGWIGLSIYLVIYFLTWRKLVGVIKYSSNYEALKEYWILAKMLQVGFIAYFVGGAFLSLSYFDLPWHFISFVVLMDKFLSQEKVMKN